MFAPVYKELVSFLQTYIRETETNLLPGTRVLAKKFGVNPATVSKALKILENQGIVTILKKGTFINGRTYVSKYKTIGIVNLIPLDYTEEDELRRLKKPFNYSPHTQTQICRVIDEEIETHGYHALSLTYHVSVIENNLSFFEQMPVDGFIFIYSSLTREIADFLKQKRIPFVAANACEDIFDVNFVDVNFPQGIDDLIQQLRGKGFRKITYYGVPNKYNTSERLKTIFKRRCGEGFRDEHFICGMMPPLLFDSREAPDFVKQGLAVMMQDGIPPDVIFCPPHCIEEMERAVGDAGLRIPEDVILVTLSIDPKIQGITAVAGDEGELFRCAAKSLMRILLDNDNSITQQWLPSRIVWDKNALDKKLGGRK